MSVFLNKAILSPFYIPIQLPHREEQLKALNDFFDGVPLEETYPCFIQFIGPVGTGKTSVAIRFGKNLEDKSRRIRFVYLNCRLENTSKTLLYRALMEKVFPDAFSKSLGAQEILKEFLRQLTIKNINLFICLDEVDYFYRFSKEHIIYDFTRFQEIFPDKPIKILGIVFIARSLAFHNALEPSERSTLGLNIISFPPYSSSQIYDILEARAEKAFKPGKITIEALKLIADLTSNPPANGDVRYALNMLFRAGVLADRRNDTKVTVEHVRIAYGTLKHPSINDLMDLSKHAKLALLGIARILRSEGCAYAPFSSLNEGYKLVCEEFNIKPLKMFEKLLQELYDKNIVFMKSLMEFGISNIPVEELDKALTKIAEDFKNENEVIQA